MTYEVIFKSQNKLKSESRGDSDDFYTVLVFEKEV